MNSRSGFFTFVLFLFLAMMITLQILAMKQSDRLYERLSVLLERRGSFTRDETTRTKDKKPTVELPMEEYPGDDGDWLVRHFSGEPRTLNPITERSLVTSWITIGTIFERLFEYDIDHDGVKLKPWLAESMDISEDGREFTIKLRDDIWFSDGVPVTADDVIFTFETIMNPGVDASSLQGYYNKIAKLEKISDRTVKFTARELTWKTLEIIGIFEVLPKHIYQFDDPKEFNERRSDPVGSGPYVFEKWDVGQRIVLRRNENYWGHKPRISKRVFKFITNKTAALQALRSGDIDILEPTSEQYVDMKADEDFKKEFDILSYWQPSGGYSYIGWNQNTPYFKDKRVRLAMTHMIDRESIHKYLYKGYGEMVTGPFYMHGKQSNPNIKPWPYDIEKAKQLLDEAGWVDTDGDGIRDKDGMPFRFKYSYNPGGSSSERLAKLMKDAGDKVGIDVIPNPLEWSIFSEKLRNRELESAILMWGGTIESDPYQIWHSSQMKGRGSNFIGFNNPEADALIEEARVTMDPEKRYALYHKFHQILHDEQPYTFLFTRPESRFVHKRFKNIIIHKLGLDEVEWYVPKEKQKYK